MKRKLLALMMVIAVTAAFAGCSKKESINTIPVNQASQSSQTQPQENPNKFFFKDISPDKQYIYEGTVWGENVVEGNKPEDVDEEGRVKVKASLVVSEIARLSKGKVYELNFSVYGAKNNTKQKDEILYLWVTEDKVYDLQASEGWDYSDCIENGQTNYLKMAKKFEKSGQLPSSGKSNIRCSNENNSFTEGLWETEIETNNNTCKFLSSHNSGHYLEFVWEIGKGLITYSRGYGAMREGIKLELFENNEAQQNSSNQSGQTNNSANSSISTIPQRGNNLDSFVPTGWKMLESTQGDLNKDGISDLAAVIEKVGVSNEAPPRILFVAFGDSKGGYSLSVQSDKAILKSDEGGVWGDPFSELSISRGSLLIGFYGGSNWRWERTYRFRYQDNGWYMIGATISSSFTGTNQETIEDYNLLTGDVIKTETNADGKSKTLKANRGKKKLVSLLDFAANSDREQF